MAYYMISYDIRARPGHDYQPLYDQLNSWGATHLQNSIWLASLNGKAAVVRDVLRNHMHTDDTFCVLQIFPNSDWATWNARTTGTDWLKAQVAPQ